jgi:hypothetical protein
MEFNKRSYAIDPFTGKSKQIRTTDCADGVYRGTFIYSAYSRRFGSVNGFSRW